MLLLFSLFFFPLYSRRVVIIRRYTIYWADYVPAIQQMLTFPYRSSPFFLGLLYTLTVHIFFIVPVDRYKQLLCSLPFHGIVCKNFYWILSWYYLASLFSLWVKPLLGKDCQCYSDSFSDWFSLLVCSAVLLYTPNFVLEWKSHFLSYNQMQHWTREYNFRVLRVLLIFIKITSPEQAEWKEKPSLGWL